jgi:hypothetical protein
LADRTRVVKFGSPKVAHLGDAVIKITAYAALRTNLHLLDVHPRDLFYYRRATSALQGPRENQSVKTPKAKAAAMERPEQKGVSKLS